MLFKLPSFKKKTAQKVVVRQPHRALLLPEILDRIFTFVDDNTLHDTVLLVCRQWFSLNKHRVIRELFWSEVSKDSNSMRLDKIISRLPRATHLKWISDDQTKISKDTQKLFQALQGLDKTVRANITGSLRAADLEGTDSFLLKTLSYLPPITVLRLCILPDHTIDMKNILQTCPNLHTLQLDSPSTFYLQGNWITPSNDRDSGTGSSPSTIPILPLRSLHLENACFSQASLESLLEVTPHLKHLQLRNLRPQGYEGDYDWTRLYKCLTSLSLQLHSIHFSIFGRPAAEDSEEIREKVLMICPQATEWAFRSSDLTPILKQCLQELPNVVTTLDLIKDSVNLPSKALALHQYLCESRHLLHLKAGGSFCLIERMDLYGRWKNLPDNEETAYRQPGVWMCRQLQTLQIEVHNLVAPVHLSSPIRTRVLFGYISKVCPNLRELEIWESDNEPGFNLELSGGLCLLGGLRLLEHLRIGSGKNNRVFKPHDLKWIFKSGRSRVSKIQRKQVMYPWASILAKERAQEKERQGRIAQGIVPDLVAPEGLEPELGRDLVNLGLLTDVKMMLDKMNSDEGYDSFPRLQSLSIYSDGRKRISPEKEYQRINVSTARDNMLYFQGGGGDGGL
ncbi:hypothetical protein BGZ95_001732 [Linnemannia exigua]|uniref:F-box domain-containing protein n=1 Tax=Linnemannia exigua TaxID=604196 RepID=A0AAD4D6V8_9FUNG|nr:hypothetical protein BGZ95_001732 [Linnemannia exigua]